MDVVEAPRQPPTVAVERPAAEPGVAGPPIPGDDPVVEREAEQRQLLVGGCDRRQPLEAAPEVVAEEAGQPAEERRRVGGRRRRRRRGGRRARRAHGERVGARRRRLEDRDRIGGEVRPAGVAARAGRSRAGRGPGRSRNASATSIARAAAIRSGQRGGGGAARWSALGRDHGPMIRPAPASVRPAAARRGGLRRRAAALTPAARRTRLASRGCGRATSASPSGAAARPGNAITDVAGRARRLTTTLIEGDGPLVVGRGPDPDRRHRRRPARPATPGTSRSSPAATGSTATAS